MGKNTSFALLFNLYFYQINLSRVRPCKAGSRADTCRSRLVVLLNYFGKYKGTRVIDSKGSHCRYRGNKLINFTRVRIRKQGRYLKWRLLAICVSSADTRSRLRYCCPRCSTPACSAMSSWWPGWSRIPWTRFCTPGSPLFLWQRRWWRVVFVARSVILQVRSARKSSHLLERCASVVAARHSWISRASSARTDASSISDIAIGCCTSAAGDSCETSASWRSSSAASTAMMKVVRLLLRWLASDMRVRSQ